MPRRPWSVIGQGDGGLRDVGGGRDRDGRHSVGDRGRVVHYRRVKALRLRVGGPLDVMFKRRPPRKAQRPQRCVRGGRHGTGHGDDVGFPGRSVGSGDRNRDYGWTAGYEGDLMPGPSPERHRAGRRRWPARRWGVAVTVMDATAWATEAV